MGRRHRPERDADFGRKTVPTTVARCAANRPDDGVRHASYRCVRDAGSDIWSNAHPRRIDPAGHVGISGEVIGVPIVRPRFAIRVSNTTVTGKTPHQRIERSRKRAGASHSATASGNRAGRLDGADRRRAGRAAKRRCGIEDGTGAVEQPAGTSRRVGSKEHPISGERTRSESNSTSGSCGCPGSS